MDLQNNEESHTTDLRNHKNRVPGINTIKVEIFLIIKTAFALREIIKEDIELLRAEKIRIHVKRTVNEHTNKIEFLAGPIIDNANVQ